jgi:hypothetical protein
VQVLSGSVVKRIRLILLTVILVAACTGDASGGGDTTAGSDTETPTTRGGGTTTTQDGGTPTTSGSAAAPGEPRTIELDVTGTTTYDSGSGVTLSIDDARVGDITSLAAEDLEELSLSRENPDSLSFLILTITVTNGGDVPIGFYPDQGTALVGSEQVTANFFLSASFTGGGGSILDGATVTEDVYFELSQLADEVAALGQARYTVSGPSDDETFESLGDDVDLTVEWSGSSG